MAADLSLIVHAAERDAGVIAPQCAGDAQRDGRFAHARRADQTQDLPRQLRCELAHGQRLQNALLDLFQTEVVSVEDARRSADVQPLLRAPAPRQLQYKIEIIAQQRRLGRGGRLLGEPAALAEELFFGLLRQLQRADAAAVIVAALVAVAVAELLVDGVQLLAQIVFALVLVHALLDLFGDLVFKIENIQLLRKKHRRLLQTADRMQLLEELLLFLIGKRGVLADKIGKIAGPRVLKQVGQRVAEIFRSQIDKALQLRLHLPHEGLRFRKVRVRGLLGQRDDTAEQIRLRVHNIQKPRTRHALNENTHIVPRQAQDLPDDGHGADLIEVRAGGVVLLCVLLGHEENALILAHGLFHGAGGLFAAHVEMRQHIREHAQPPQRQHRQHGRTFKIVHRNTPF